MNKYVTVNGTERVSYLGPGHLTSYLSSTITAGVILFKDLNTWNCFPHM